MISLLSLDWSKGKSKPETRASIPSITRLSVEDCPWNQSNDYHVWSWKIPKSPEIPIIDGQNFPWNSWPKSPFEIPMSKNPDFNGPSGPSRRRIFPSLRHSLKEEASKAWESWLAKIHGPWLEIPSIELLDGKNHGNIMGEHPTGPGSLEPSRGSKYCSSTVRLRNGKNSTVNFENCPRITGADYRRAYKKNQNGMEKPRGNPTFFMIKWWILMDLSILMLICGQVKEWRKVWVGNRSADGWFWSFIYRIYHDIPPPIWVKFWNANFRWLRNPKFSWSNGQSCVMLILTFWESTCFPY